MSDPILIAIIAAIAGMGTVFSPLILAHMAARQRRAEKQLDWAREDRVADQAAEAARLLLAANERVAKTAAVTNAKLDVIHTLVNSTLTAAMQAEYDATVRTLALMREVAALKQAAGQEPTDETAVAIDAMQARVTELKVAVDDRLTQTAVADQQLAAVNRPDDEEGGR
jgi:hypothetical protein